MKAIVQDRYGSSEALELVDIDKPTLDDDKMLIRVRASSINPADYHLMTGKPYLTRLVMGFTKPKARILGADFAGIVDSVGKDITKFKVGDEVFGQGTGSYSEFAVAGEKSVALKPEGVTFEQAASLPIAGVTAVLGVRHKGNVTAGQTVLVNGASGGVGHFAVQIAKALGAEVTGVCSAKNMDMVVSIGADHVIDYGAEDFTASDKRYDMILDMAGGHTILEFRAALNPDGIYVQGGDEEMGNWVGPITGMLKVVVASKTGKQTMINILARTRSEDLKYLADLIVSDDLRPVIGRTIGLAEVPAALDAQAKGYGGTGRSHGKTVVVI